MIQNEKQTVRTQEKPIHTVNLTCRSKMEISGVREVTSFDESGAVMNTVDGELTVEGEGIKIGELTVSGGNVILSGRINAIYYAAEAAEKKRSVFSRLFG